MVRRSRRLYFLWWAIAPALISVATFGVLCSRECTALPWLTFAIAPLVAAGLGLVAAVVYWLWAKALPEEEMRSARRLILWSALWGPVVGFMGLGVAMMALQVVAIVFAVFA